MIEEQNGFSMNGKWIEIFKGGQQTDSSGHVQDGDVLIDNALRLFNAEHHEPPVVIGHPKDNAPAWAWVAGLREKVVNGAKVLEAKLKDVQADFADMVQQGRFKKRSAAFYPDGSLRHVGFLGAAPPAVKGLSDVAFSNSDEIIEFETELQGGEVMTETQTEYGKNAATKDVEKQEPKIDFSEALKTQEIKLRAEFAEQLRNQNVAHFVDREIAAGRMLPAWKDAGITEFMRSLRTDEIQFSESQKATPEKWFKEFIAGLAKFNLFQEIATKDKAAADIKESDEDEKIAKDIAGRVNPKGA
jgi:hypothetical protein